MKMKVKQPLFPILLGAVFLVLLIPVFYTMILSIKNYTPFKGLVGSEFVGVKNFGVLFGSPYFPNVFSNTLIISIIGMLAGAVYVFFASLTTGSIEDPRMKTVSAVVFAMPALIPVVFARFFIPKDMLIGEIPGYQMITGVLGGLRLAGIVSVVSLFTKGDSFKQSIKTALLFVVLKAVSLFTPDVTVSLTSYNPMIYEVADTLATYTYRTGLIESNFSFSAAVSMVRMFMQVILAVPMILVAKYVMSQDEAVVPKQPHYSMLSVTMIVPLGIFLLAMVLCGSLFPENVSLAPFYINSLLVCIPSAILVAFVSYALAVLGRNSGIYGVICTVVLCALSGNFISEYMMIRQIGLLNTHFGIALNNLRLVPMITVLIMFATKAESNYKKDIGVIIVMAFAVFAWLWGDIFSDSILLQDRAKYTASLCVREAGMFSAQENTSLMSSAPFIIIPVIAMTVGGILTTMLNISDNPEIK